MIQIDFFDENIINDLVPIKSMKPDRVIFIMDRKDFNSEAYRHSRDSINHFLRNCVVEFLTCDSSDLSDIIEVLKRCIELQSDPEIYIDITGGNELMSIASGFVAKQYPSIQVVYADMKHEKMICVNDLHMITTIEHIDLEDYLLAKGAKQLGSSRVYPLEQEHPIITEMAEYVFANLDKWRRLYEITKMHAHDDGFKCEEESLMEMLMKFNDLGFIRLDGQKFLFCGDRYREYMCTYGIWLELYMYIKACRVYEEAYLGLLIDWNRFDEKDSRDNEIDLVIMDHSVPIFISCKMTQPDTFSIYEVFSLTKRFGGGNAKAIIATTYPIRTTKNSSNGLYYKLKGMKIGSIEAADFLTISARGVFNNALSNTE